MDFLSSASNVVTILKKDECVALPVEEDIAYSHNCHELDMLIEECKSIDCHVALFYVNFSISEKTGTPTTTAVLMMTVLKNS